VGVGVPLALFLALGVWVSRGTPHWDTTIVDDLRAGGALRAVLGTLITAAEVAGGLFAAAVVLLLLRRRDRRALAFYVVALGGGLLLIPLLKHGFHRPSINLGVKGYTGYSFPSGHAIGSTAVTLPAVIVFRRGYVGALLVVAGLGYALVARHAHYPSDVLAGWCVAVSWVSAVWVAFQARRAPAAAEAD
jgi:undecaprenyl-diphosphatase